MPYTTPGTATAGDVYTASAHNVIVGDIIDHETRILTTGQVLTKSQAFSAAASVSVTSCFNSTYTNYNVIIDCTFSTTNTATIQLAASGVASTTGYYVLGSITEAASGPTRQSDANVSSINLFGGSTGTNGATFTVYRPNQAASFTTFTGTTFGGTGVSVFLRNFGAQHNVAAAYDGLILAFPGTMTGNIRVYGMLNS
jgi:hypothetical protein